MEKVILGKKEVQNTVLDINGQKIEVLQYMSIEVQKFLIASFLLSYFDNNERDYLTSQYANMIALLDVMTNVDVDNNLDIQSIVASGTWNKIIHSIDNYPDFELALNDAIQEEKNKRDNLSYVVSGFLNQITPLLKQLSDVDFSDDKVKQINDLIVNFNTELNKAPVGAIMKEAIK